MIDYSFLEQKFRDFLINFLYYERISHRVVSHPESPKRDPQIENQELILRRKLEQDYGELSEHLNGLGGEIFREIQGRRCDRYLEALDPRLEKDNLSKWEAIQYSIQHIDRAIGSCRNATKVVESETQIVIEKGAKVEGLMKLRKILLEAKNSIKIQDRYLNSDIFNIILEIDKTVDIRIIVFERTNFIKDLVMIYHAYKADNTNVEIKKAPKDFHSRNILIDGIKGFNSDFTFQDIGNVRGFVHKIESSNLPTSIQEFETLWNSAIPL